MSDMQFDAYLNLLTRFLRLSPRQREEIRRELRAHLEEAIEAELARGRTREEAINRILDDFGDAAELAARFSVLSNRKRWIMRGTLAAACLGFAAMTLLAIWPSPVGPVGAVVAESPAPATGGDVTAVGAIAPSSEVTTDDRVIAQRLAAPIDAKFEETPLFEVLDFVGQALQANMFVQRRQLEERGISMDTPITLNTRGLSIERTLRLALDAAGTEQPLGFVIDQGVVIFGPEDSLPRRVMTRVYEVGELLNAGAATNVATTAQVPQLHQGTAGTRSAPAEPGESATPEERLVNIIINGVAPDSWRDSGGSSTISVFDSVLVVRCPLGVQQEVASLIDELRKAIKVRAGTGSSSGPILIHHQNAQQSPGDARTITALDSRVSDLVFEDQPIASVIAFLEDLCKISIRPEWSDLSDAGVNPDRRVSMTVGSMQLRKLLRELFNVPNPIRPIIFEAKDGVLVITAAPRTKTKDQ